MIQLDRKQIDSDPEYDILLTDDGDTLWLAEIKHQADPGPVNLYTAPVYQYAHMAYGTDRAGAMALVIADMQHIVTCPDSGNHDPCNRWAFTTDWRPAVWEDIPGPQRHPHNQHDHY